MEWVYTIQCITLALCWINYGLGLYRSGYWNFADYKNIGWLMAVLGWTNVVF